MLISNLNYLNEVSSESTDLSGGFGLGRDYTDIKFSERFSIKKKVYSNTYVKGNLATVESDAYAEGYGTLTQVFTLTETTPYSSFSKGVSISASN